MGRLLIAAALGIGAYLVHTGQLQIGGSGLRQTTGAVGGYSAAPRTVSGGVTRAASNIGN